MRRRAGSQLLSATSAALAFLFLAALTLTPGHAVADSGSCTVSTFASADVPKAIPDPGSTESVVAVPGGDPVAAIAIQLTVIHPFDSDLELELVSPAGDVITLAEAVGLWGHDFADTVFDDAASSSITSELPPFTGRFRPAEPLAAFAGTPREGTWKLRVSDLRGRYAGKLESWRLDVTSCSSAQPADTIPGASEPPRLPQGVPRGHVPVEGSLITVTTTSDAPNGDVSTVARLQSNPGPDGIALREAIEATNNDPGTYTIRFESSLGGRTIEVGPGGAGALHPLKGGAVLIDGDIDGDGRPDVTIANRSTDHWAGLDVASGNNRLHALALEGFSTAVLFSTPLSFRGSLPSRQTFARNVLSGLKLAASQIGIFLSPTEGFPECDATACQTGNRWSDTRFVGNTVEAVGGGIEAELRATAGESVEGITLAGNDIHLLPGTSRGGMSVNLLAGGVGGADENRISDAVVAYNSVEAERFGNAINVLAGGGGGRANVVEDVRIVGNHVSFTEAARVAGGVRRGVSLGISDGCSGPGPGEGVCSTDNVARRIEIVGNRLDGQDDAGVLIPDPCCPAARGGSLTDVRIARNLVEGVVPSHALNPWGIVIGSAGAPVSKVIVDSNTVEQQTTEPEKEHTAYLAGGGIAILGGLGGEDGSIRDVAVTNNRIDTNLLGIALVGGGPSDEPAAQNARRNSVSGVQLRGNVIVRVPVLATRWDAKAKGITVIGGLGGTPPATGNWRASTGNSVTSVSLQNNLVAGVVDDVSVRSNVGQGASGNVAALGLRPPILAVSKSGTGAGTVTSGPSGIACGSACAHEFDDRTEVTLTASAAVGSSFVGWSGDCSGGGACALTMTADRSVTATFRALPPRVSCIVPNVKGKTLAAAKRALARAHCSLGTVRRATSTKKKGTVVAQRPRPGKKLAEGAKVSIVVSKGKRK